jgi:hypothetical protein
VVAEQTPAREDHPRRDGLVDAQRFLTLTGRLRVVRERIEASNEVDRRRAHWHRLLVAVTDAARSDLSRAEEKLTRLEAEIDRFLGEA